MRRFEVQPLSLMQMVMRSAGMLRIALYAQSLTSGPLVVQEGYYG